MKKINTLILFCLLTIMSFAQTTKTATTNKYRLGFKVSPNISWLASDNNNINLGSNALKFGYGMIFDVFFSENYAIGTGLNVNKTGANCSYFITNTDLTEVAEINRNLNLQYAQIPLTFKMKTKEIGYLTYWGQFGLGLNMKLKSTSDDETDYLLDKNIDVNNNFIWENSSKDNLISNNKDITNESQIFSSNLIFAAGVEYNLSENTSLLVGLTYQNGFTDILKGTGVTKNGDKNSPVFSEDALKIPETFQLNETTGLNAFNKPRTMGIQGVSYNYIELNIGILF